MASSSSSRPVDKAGPSHPTQKRPPAHRPNTADQGPMPRLKEAIGRQPQRKASWAAHRYICAWSGQCSRPAAWAPVHCEGLARPPSPKRHSFLRRSAWPGTGWEEDFPGMSSGHRGRRPARPQSGGDGGRHCASGPGSDSTQALAQARRAGCPISEPEHTSQSRQSRQPGHRAHTEPRRPRAVAPAGETPLQASSWWVLMPGAECHPSCGRGWAGACLSWRRSFFPAPTPRVRSCPSHPASPSSSSGQLLPHSRSTQVRCLLPGAQLCAGWCPGAVKGPCRDET